MAKRHRRHAIAFAQLSLSVYFAARVHEEGNSGLFAYILLATIVGSLSAILGTTRLYSIFGKIGITAPLSLLIVGIAWIGIFTSGAVSIMSFFYYSQRYVGEFLAFTLSLCGVGASIPMANIIFSDQEVES